MRKILACTDGSTHAASVYQHAAWAATRLASEVEVLHVINHHREHAEVIDLSGTIGFDASTGVTEELTRLEETQGREARLKGKAILEEAQRQLATAGCAKVNSIQRHGTLVETVAELESNAELVVIGKSGEHAVLREGQIGGHLENLLRVSRRPTLVVERAFRPIQRILIAFDNSSSAQRAIDYAATSPLLRVLEVHLVMVGRSDAAHELALAEAREKLSNAGLVVSARQLPGRAAVVISDLVKTDGIDLLLMGAYGHSPIREFFAGSTTTKLVRTCPVSVLMFHGLAN
jgi:nucleotide-binding universal stress UspA family protein